MTVTTSLTLFLTSLDQKERSVVLFKCLILNLHMSVIYTIVVHFYSNLSCRGVNLVCIIPLSLFKKGSDYKVILLDLHSLWSQL
jgi:hypothetical protein